MKKAKKSPITRGKTIIPKLPSDARRNLAKLERGRTGISPAKKGLRDEDKGGWISGKTLRKRLGGFINSELGISGTSVKDLRAELKYAAKELKRQFPKGTKPN